MNKTEFLKEAKAKYKAAVDKKWVSEMNFIFSDELILRVWFDVNFQKEIIVNKSDKEFGDTAFMHRWCTVDTLPKQADEKIKVKLGEYISEDAEHYSKIIFALREKLATSPDMIADDVEFELGGEMDTLTMWEPIERNLSVKQLCDLVGIK